MGLHLAVREQVATNRPAAGIAEVHAKLARKHAGGAHEAEHRMLELLAEQLGKRSAPASAPDENAYLGAPSSIGLSYQQIASTVV